MATIAELLVEIRGDNKQLKRTLQDSQKQTQSFFTSVKNFAAGAGLLFGTQEILRFGKEAALAAGQAEGVEAAFNKLNKPGLLNNLTKATRGTVDQLKLMQQAVRAQNFQVPLNKLATFFEFATKRAAQTGESVDYLVQSIIDGIGRKSTLVLDNLGISASELQEEIAKVGDFGAAAGNIIERELGKAGDVATTSAQRYQQWGATIKNLQVRFGELINQGLNALFGSAEKTTNKLEDLRTELNLEIDALQAGNLSQEARAKLIDQINTKYGEYLPNLIKETDSIEDLERVQRQANKAFLDRILLQSQQEELTKLSQNLIEAEKGLLNVEIERAKIQEQLRFASDPQTAAALEQQLKNLTVAEQINTATKAHAEEQIGQLTKSYEALRERLGIFDESVKTSTGNLGKQVSALQEISKIADNIGEDINKVIQDAITSDVLKGEGIEIDARINAILDESFSNTQAEAFALVQERIAENFTDIEQRALAFGDSFDVISEKQAVLRSQIENLLSQGFSPMSAQVQQLREQLLALGDAGLTAGENMQIALAQAGAAAIANADSFLEASGMILGALAREIVALAVRNALTSPAAAAAGPFAIAIGAAAGVAAEGLVRRLIGGINLSPSVGDGFTSGGSTGLGNQGLSSGTREIIIKGLSGNHLRAIEKNYEKKQQFVG